ncbi:hypothetical protein CYMTET_52084, partial [Cymbomonas tetramitiformis]
ELFDVTFLSQDDGLKDGHFILCEDIKLIRLRRRRGIPHNEFLRIAGCLEAEREKAEPSVKEAPRVTLPGITVDTEESFH